MICQRLFAFSFCALCLLSANGKPRSESPKSRHFLPTVPDMSMMRVGDTYYEQHHYAYGSRGACYDIKRLD